VALNFPNSPTVGQTYTDVTSGFSYEWDGTVWKSYTPASSSNIKILDDISGSFDGVTQTFSLTSNSISITPANAQQLRIVLGGVVQSPGVDYTISTSNIVFTTAPSAALDFSGVSLGPAVPVTYANDGNIYIRNTYTGAGTTGPFAFSQGYTIGYLDVYRNGVRLSSGTDYVGTSGTNFFLSEVAEVNDEIEAIGYTVTALVQASSNLDNLNVTGVGTFVNINVTGTATIATLEVDSFTNINVTGVGTIATLDVNGPADFVNINATGIVTATGFSTSTGTSTQFLKADGSVDGSTYLTSYTETSTLNNILSRGNSSSLGMSVGLTTFTNGVRFNKLLTEKVNITAGKLSDNTNINLENGMVHYFTTTETTTSTPNIRYSSTASLDSVMAVGETISVTLFTTAAAAGYSAQLTIDGGAVTENWIGGSAPTAGGAGGLDIYSYSIIKTGSATFKVIANLTNAA
jgi:hypothetical protein